MVSYMHTVMVGFREDCETLMARFEKADDIRFNTFCEIWKDMKFPLVFAYHQKKSGLLEFSEEALHISKQFLLQPTRFKERIGGLYLVYGVYYKMPIDRFKIRLKLSDFRTLCEFHEQIIEGEHLDANYILSKLISDNAFHYCFFDREFGLEKYFRPKEKQCVNPYSILPVAKCLAEPEQILSQISELSTLYREKKQQMMINLKKNTSLDLYNANIAKDILKEIEQLDGDKRRSEPSTSTQGKDQEESTSKDSSVKTTRKLTSTKIRRQLGHGFNTDSSESESESYDEADDYDPNLPESFD